MWSLLNKTIENLLIQVFIFYFFLRQPVVCLVFHDLQKISVKRLAIKTNDKIRLFEVVVTPLLIKNYIRQIMQIAA